MSANFKFYMLLLLPFVWQTYCLAQGPLERISFSTGYSQSAQSPSLLRADQVSSWAHNIHSIYFGLGYSQKINRNWAWEIGLRTCEKGYQVSYASRGYFANVYINYQYHLHYLEMPLLFVYSKQHFRLRIGASPSYLLASDYKFEQTLTNSIYFYQLKFATPDNGHKKLDLSLSLGLGFKLNDFFELEFSVQRGLVYVDNYQTSEIKYQETGLLGFRYLFLKSGHYLIDRREADAYKE
jgi:hypothetical protein